LPEGAAWAGGRCADGAMYPWGGAAGNWGRERGERVCRGRRGCGRFGRCAVGCGRFRGCVALEVCRAQGVSCSRCVLDVWPLQEVCRDRCVAEV